MDFRYLINLCEAAYDSKIAALIRQYPDQADAINWAKNLKKQDRVVWYLNLLERYLKNPDDALPILGYRHLSDFQENLLHFLGQENIATIQNYRFTTQTAEQVSQDFSRLEQEFLAKKQQVTQPPGRYDAKQGDVELLRFKDGTRWVKLNTAYCKKEGVSGAHCGNVVGQTKKNQRILSLRSSTDQVILTFILEPDGTLGEMKARFNNKPQEKYHPQIMELLLQNYIKGISGGGYLADQNFSVFDLDESYLKILHEKKPELIRTQIQVTPVEILKAPEWIRNDPNYSKLAINKLPQLKKLLGDASIENWEEAIRENEDLILYAPDQLPKYRERLLQYLVVKPHETLLKTRKKYRTDFNFLKDILSLKGDYIKAISTNQRGYTELANIAVKENGQVLDYIPKEFRTPDICLAAVKQDGRALYDVPEEFRTPEMSWAAVKQYGLALRYVPTKLRTPEMCLAAVKQNGHALDYVPKEFRTPDICLVAVKQHGHALDYVPDELLTPEMCWAAVKQDANALDSVPKELLTPELCLAAVKQDGGTLTFVPKELRTIEICLAAVKQDANALYDVPAKLKAQVLKKLKSVDESLQRIRQLAGL